MMAQMYSDDFHEFLETYGELLDQVEGTRDELEVIQEEMSSRLEDLYGEMEETMKLLRILEQQVWQFRGCRHTEALVVKVQEEDKNLPFLLENPEKDEEDPFADLWKV